MKNKWLLPLIIIGRVILWSMRGKIPSGTPVDVEDNVLLRDRYTLGTMWIPYESVNNFLAGGWVYA